MREKMKKENPKIVMGEFMKMVSMEWTRMSQEEKKRYERLVQTDRARYDKEFAEFKRNLNLDNEWPPGQTYCGGRFGEDDPDEFDQEDKDYKNHIEDNPREGVLIGKIHKHIVHDDIQSFSEIEMGGLVDSGSVVVERKKKTKKHKKYKQRKPLGIQKLGD
jgi:hypothetical protein